MKTITRRRKPQVKTPQQQQPLFTEAFEILTEHLGLEKTVQMWQVLVPSYGDYERLRPTLFEGKDAKTLDKEIVKFNRTRKRT